MEFDLETYVDPECSLEAGDRCSIPGAMDAGITKQDAQMHYPILRRGGKVKMVDGNKETLYVTGILVFLFLHLGPMSGDIFEDSRGGSLH